MASLSFEGETHAEIVQKVRRWLASTEHAEEGHLTPHEAIDQAADVTKETLRIIASAAPEPVAHSDVVKALTSAGYKATDATRQAVKDGLDAIQDVSGGSLVTARNARRSIVYEMNAAVARQVLRALRPR
ncbi:MAG: hypothetical protein ACRD0G_20555 [Acidimicrobiales bacterium]